MAKKVKYTAYTRTADANPFRGNGGIKTQTVEVDASTTLAQVETWAKEAAAEAGLIFIRVEKQ